MLENVYEREAADFIHAPVGCGPSGFDRPAAAPRLTRLNGCARCGGLMVACYFNGAQGNLADELLPCRRCLNCGDLVDAQVLANRLARRR